MQTLFTKIIEGSIPSVQLYSDQLCVVILDIAPVNKGHALVISKEVYPTTESAPASLLAHMMEITQKLDKIMREKLQADATNIIINNGPAAGQEVPHLHIHVIPRFNGDHKRLIFPKESYQEGEMSKIGELLTLS